VIRSTSLIGVTRRPTRTRGSAHSDRRWTAFWLLLPATLGLVVFTFAPIGYALLVSFQEFELLAGPGGWVGLANYHHLFEDPLFLRAVVTTSLYTAMTLVAQVTLGLALAILVNQKIRGLAFFRTAYFLPVVASFVVMAAVWKSMYAQSGIFNTFLITAGFQPHPFLTSVREALPSLAVLGVWKFVGFDMLVFLGGLQAIPREIYQVADIDGAGPIRKFFHITLPLLKRVLLFVVVITTIESFNVFTPVYQMTKGGPQESTHTLVYHIFVNGFRYFDMGYATAMSFALVVFVGGLVALQFRLLRTDVEY
jgi:multiple sugar transport system permease protein